MPLSDLGVLCYDKLMGDLPGLIEEINSLMGRTIENSIELDQEYKVGLTDFSAVNPTIEELRYASRKLNNLLPLDRLNSFEPYVNR